MSGPGGYREGALGGARVRADIVDVYVFRRAAGGAEFLQLLRAREPLAGSWHPVMGHAEAGEPAVRTALREMEEEVGLGAGDPALLGLWALEQVHPYFVPEVDAVVLGPRFAAEAATAWEPRLNGEHSAARWTAVPAGGGTASDLRAALRRFVWPGQRACVEEVMEEIVAPGPAGRAPLRIG